MPPELQSSESLAGFAGRIKQKYPAYADLEDEELVRRVLEKYPVYRDRVNLEPAAAPPQPSAPAPRPAAQPETFIERHPALAKGMDILGGVAEKAGLIPSVADITSKQYVESIHRWHEQAVKAQREGKPEPPFPKKPEGAEIKIPSTFKAAMDVPLLPLGEMAPAVPKGAIPVPGVEEALAVGGGLADIVQSFTTPRNVAIIGSMVALGPYRLAQRLVEAGFAAEMAPAAAEQISAGYDQWLEGNKTRAVRTWTGGAATAALAAFLGAKAVKAKGAEVPARAEARAQERALAPEVAGIKPPVAPVVKERGVPPPAPQEAVKAPPAPREPPAGVLPGMERAVEAQKAGAARVEAERLGEEFARPLEERAGKGIEGAPIFRGTEAAAQRELPIETPAGAAQRELVSPLGIERRSGRFFDEFGDEIKVGGRVVDSMGRPAEVREVVAAEDVLGLRAQEQPSLARGYVVARFAGGAKERIPLGDVTVKRRGRPQEVGRPATEAERRRRLGVSVRSVGTEEMGRLRHGTPSREELGFPREGERGGLVIGQPPPFQPNTPEANVFSRISKEPTPRTASLEGLYTSVVDALRPVQRTVESMEKARGQKLPAEENAYVLARLLVGWTGKVSEFLDTATLDAKTLRPTGKPLREILRPIENNLDDLRVYLVSRRAIELSLREKPIEAGIPLADAQATVRNIESKHPQVKQIAEELHGFQDSVLRYLRDSGVMDEAQYQAIKSLNKEYVPFFRVMEQSPTGIGKDRLGDLWNPVKRIKGSERAIIDPLESIVKNLYTIINLADRNSVMLSLVKQAEKTKGAWKYIERVKTPVRPTTFELGEIKNSLRDAGFSKAEIESADLEVLATIFRPSHLSSPAKGILTVIENGKRQYYKVHDADLYKALQGLDKESSSLIISLLSKPASLLRLGATGLGPEFLIRNPLRDTMDAWFQTEVGFRPGIDTLKGLASFLKKDQAYHEWRRAGGEHAALISVDRTSVQKNFSDLMMNQTKWVVRHPIEAARMLSESLEAATRIGVFRRGREGGLSPREATLQSREGTLDFQRMGAKTRAVNQIVAFWNAAVQGTDKFVRTHNKNPTGALLKGVAGVTIPSLLLWWANKDDPRYQALPHWEKDIFWHVSTKGTALENTTAFVRIPKPFLWGLTYGTLVERFAEWVEKRELGAWDGFVDSMLEGTLPDVIPTAFKPYLEALTNYDLFRERPVEPRGLERLPPEERATPYTSEFSKSVVRALSRNGIRIKGLDSPAKLDHVIFGYTAGLGRAVVGGIDKMIGRDGAELPEKTAADIPLVRAFATRWPTAGAEPVEHFWNRFEELDQKHQAYRASIKHPGRDIEAKRFSASEAIEYIRLKQYKNRLQNVSERIRNIQYDTMLSAAEKRKRIDYWTLLQIRLAQEALKRKTKVEVKQ